MSPLKKIWLSNFFIGMGKLIFYRLDRIFFGYPSWHCTPINRKPYAIEVIEAVEGMIDSGHIRDGYVVEVGCGRGDIIGNIDYRKRIGMDIDADIIQAAKFYHPRMDFYAGGVDSIPVDHIDALLLINWLSGVPADTVHDLLRSVLGRAKIIVFDNVEGYKFFHDGNYLFDGRYVLLGKSKIFSASHGATRWIEYWGIRNSSS